MNHRNNPKRMQGLLESGPLLRGSQAWENRELARFAVGNRCLSFGRVPNSTRIKYHYMNTNQRKK